MIYTEAVGECGFGLKSKRNIQDVSTETCHTEAECSLG